MRLVRLSGLWMDLGSGARGCGEGGVRALDAIDVKWLSQGVTPRNSTKIKVELMITELWISRESRCKIVYTFGRRCAMDADEM